MRIELVKYDDRNIRGHAYNLRLLDAAIAKMTLSHDMLSLENQRKSVEYKILKCIRFMYAEMPDDELFEASCNAQRRINGTIPKKT